MKILITGGSGNIGSRVAGQLAARGDEVVLFDVAPPRQEVRGNVRFVRGDLSVFSDVLTAVKDHGIERIFHLGALVSYVTEQNPFSSMGTNVNGTFHVLEAARLFGVERVLFSSSYGTFGVDRNGPVLDDVTLQRPTLLYGCQKLFGEGLGRWYMNRWNLDFRGIRYAQVIGAGIRTPWHWAPEMIEDVLAGRPHTSAWGSPASGNIMLSVSDAARATVELMDAPREAIEMVCYNVAGMREQVFGYEVADYLRRRCPGAEITFKQGEIPADLQTKRQTFDDSRARAEWGWSPTADTLEKIVDGMQQEISGQAEIQQKEFGA